MLPPVMLLNVATACDQWQLYSWPLLTHSFLTVDCHYTLSLSCSPTETNLMGSSQVTEWAKEPVRFSQSIFVYNSCSKIPSPFTRNVEVSCHVVTIFVLVFTHIYICVCVCVRARACVRVCIHTYLT